MRYAEDMLRFTKRHLGFAFDYGINVCGIDADRFADAFIETEIADYFDSGSPKYCGMTGTELGQEIVYYGGFVKSWDDIIHHHGSIYSYTPEYWAGWILAMYQWKRDTTFREIFRYVKLSEIIDLYYPYHEAPAAKTFEMLDEMIEERKTSR